MLISLPWAVNPYVSLHCAVKKFGYLQKLYGTFLRNFARQTPLWVTLQCVVYLLPCLLRCTSCATRCSRLTVTLVSAVYSLYTLPHPVHINNALRPVAVLQRRDILRRSAKNAAACLSSRKTLRTFFQDYGPSISRAVDFPCGRFSWLMSAFERTLK